MAIHGAGYTRRPGVSILVLVDVARGTMGHGSESMRTEFQSLFSWMLLSGWLDRGVPGFRVSILVLVDVAQWHCQRRAWSSRCREMPGTRPWFQSLFSWMLLSGRSSPRVPDDRSAFQSLFSWMLLSGTRLGRRLRTLERRGFNPCSRGCCSVAWADSPRTPVGRGFNPCSRGCCSVAPADVASRTLEVSILVLVDVAQWHSPTTCRPDD